MRLAGLADPRHRASAAVSDDRALPRAPIAHKPARRVSARGLARQRLRRDPRRRAKLHSPVSIRGPTPRRYASPARALGAARQRRAVKGHVPHRPNGARSAFRFPPVAAPGQPIGICRTEEGRRRPHAYADARETCSCAVNAMPPYARKHPSSHGPPDPLRLGPGGSASSSLQAVPTGPGKGRAAGGPEEPRAQRSRCKPSTRTLHVRTETPCPIQLSVRTAAQGEVHPPKASFAGRAIRGPCHPPMNSQQGRAAPDAGTSADQVADLPSTQP